MQPMPDTADAPMGHHSIRRLNDQLRQQHVGGRVVVTAGIQSLGPAFVREALRAVAAFEAFEAGNDPYDERDFGALSVHGRYVLFKIDPYDLDLRAHSPDPAATCRVMTIMLAEEY